MPPVVAALPRSDSKARLLTHLGLDMGNMVHRRIYNLMKLEASEGRKRIIARLNQQAQQNNQSHNATSYSTSQVDEETMDAETRYIYQTANDTTRPLYELGQDPDHPEKPNWIIRWTLWHVFRYRDGRQSRSPPRAADMDEASSVLSSESRDSATTSSDNQTPTQKNDPAEISPSRGYFDPVREQFRS